jgi:hypothetical protein
MCCLPASPRDVCVCVCVCVCARLPSTAEYKSVIVEKLGWQAISSSLENKNAHVIYAAIALLKSLVLGGGSHTLVVSLHTLYLTVSHSLSHTRTHARAHTHSYAISLSLNYLQTTFASGWWTQAWWTPWWLCVSEH